MALKRVKSSLGISGPLVCLLVAGSCEPIEDVPVQPLPAMEYPSPEARYGLPEVKGDWRFIGWQVEPGDSSLLDRSYPAFGILRLQEQRLDSVAGTLSLPRGNTHVVGEVRRDGWFALATIADAKASAYLAGRFARDTLFLEMTSMVASEDWPSGALGVFVRERDARPGPIAWFRGTDPTRVGMLPDSLAIGDSLTVVRSVAGTSADGRTSAGMPAHAAGGTSAGMHGATPASGGRDRSPDGVPASAARAETAPGVEPTSAPRSRPPAPAPSPSSSEPEPARPEETGSGPRLLGEPVTRP